MSISRQVCLNISGSFDLIKVSSARKADFVGRLQGLQVQSSRCDFTDLENNAGAQQAMNIPCFVDREGKFR